MEERIIIDIPEDVKKIINILEAAGHEAYAVGGCVRDMLLGRTPHDWDVTTSARPEEIKKLFSRTIDTGIKHGTVTVMLGKEGYEVTTYRIDGEYLDGRHPDKVEFTSLLSEDLKRRDFTINAMAVHPERGIVDLFGGQQDLQDKIIRCVGNARDRFSEDALRMMRAVRFSAQLGFSIEEDTRNAAKELSETLKKVSHERIADELLKLLCSGHPGKFIDLFELGLTKQFLPEFDDMMSCGQNTRYHCYTVGIHTIKVLENTPPEKIIRLAALLHDVGKLYTKTEEKGTDHFYGHCDVGAEKSWEILRELRLDNDTINKVCILIKYHDPRFSRDEAGVRRLIHEVSPDLMPSLITLMRADMAGKSSVAQLDAGNIDYIEETFRKIMKNNDCLYIKDLAVGGNDLIASGIPKGEAIGKILNMLLDEVLDSPEKNNREVLLEIAKSIKL